MDVKVTKQREQITELIQKDDYEGLAALGIQFLEGKGPKDCGQYVLYRLGYPARPETIQALETVERTEARKPGIIFYGFKEKGKLNVRHYGFYDGSKVISKWEHNAVFKHKIEDVPHVYGDVAAFADADELRFLVEQNLRGLGPY